MTDHRTRPRTGKSQFFPLMAEIQNRLKNGETYKQIHDDLLGNNRLEIGYHQFTKYIRTHINKEKMGRPPAEALADRPLPQNPFGVTAKPQEKRRDDDLAFHSPVPDKEKIYGSVE